MAHDIEHCPFCGSWNLSTELVDEGEGIICEDCNHIFSVDVIKTPEEKDTDYQYDDLMYEGEEDEEEEFEEEEDEPS